MGHREGERAAARTGVLWTRIRVSAGLAAGGTIEEIGRKTGAWSATSTYDPADINEANLKQYDAIFLASTTGEFLDAPS